MGFMMADMFKAVAVLGVVETLVFDFSAALGHAEDGAAADAVARGVGEPVGLVDTAVGRMLTVANHPHGFPTQGFPRVEVIGIPDLHPVLPVAKGLMGSLAVEPFLGGRKELGEIVF